MTANSRWRGIFTLLLYGSILGTGWIGLQFSVVLAAGITDRPGWHEIEPGLDFGVFKLPQKSPMGDGLLRVVRINPRRFTLGLYAVKAGDHPTPQSMRQWVAAKGLVAAINASMYRVDFATSVSYMRKAEQLLNSRFSADNSFFVMGKDGTGAASARLLDRQCDDLENLLPQQTAVVQSIRMISCKGRNVWAKSKKIWSTAALAQDKDGNILMLHVRSPYSVHDFNQMLLALPLGIIRAMYVEGGPEAQLSLHAGGLQIDLLGSYETGFNENDDNHRGWDVPNIIGARRQVPE